MIFSKDITIITFFSEYYETSSTTPDYYTTTEYHIPFFAFLLILGIILYIGERLLIEFLIRWRK